MASDELDAAVADAVAQCEGDVLAAVRMLVVAVNFWQGLAGRLADAVSPGFVRGDPALTVPEPFRKADRLGGSVTHRGRR